MRRCFADVRVHRALAGECEDPACEGLKGMGPCGLGGGRGTEIRHSHCGSRLLCVGLPPLSAGSPLCALRPSRAVGHGAWDSSLSGGAVVLGFLARRPWPKPAISHQQSPTPAIPGIQPTSPLQLRATFSRPAVPLPPARAAAALVSGSYPRPVRPKAALARERE